MKILYGIVAVGLLLILVIIAAALMRMDTVQASATANMVLGLLCGLIAGIPVSVGMLLLLLRRGSVEGKEPPKVWVVDQDWLEQGRG